MVKEPPNAVAAVIETAEVPDAQVMELTPSVSATPTIENGGNQAETAVMGAVTAAAALASAKATDATEVTAADTAVTQAATAAPAKVSVPESVPVVAVVPKSQEATGSIVAAGDSPAPEAITDLVANYSDKLLMLVFWSVDTEIDSPSFDWLNEMHNRYAEQGLQIMAVNQDEAAREGEAFAVKQGAQFDVTHDRSGDLSRALWVGKLPATYLLNDAGELLGSHTGFNDDIRGSYEDEIRRSLRAVSK